MSQSSSEEERPIDGLSVSDGDLHINVLCSTDTRSEDMGLEDLRSEFQKVAFEPSETKNPLPSTPDRSKATDKEQSVTSPPSQIVASSGPGKNKKSKSWIVLEDQATMKVIQKILDAKEKIKLEKNKLTEKLVVIVWEVSFRDTENALSAKAYQAPTAADINPASDAMNDSIRRGLHDIFDRNLGFETMNSHSALCVPASVLVSILWDEKPINCTDEEILNALRDRIDFLIAFGLSGIPYVDFARASRWLAEIVNLGCDDHPLTPRVNSAPFTMFIANRTRAFNNRVW